MSDGLGSISKIFGSRRFKGFSDIRTFFRTNESTMTAQALHRTLAVTDGCR
jgi:hypothetical protein